MENNFLVKIICPVMFALIFPVYSYGAPVEHFRYGPLVIEPSIRKLGIKEPPPLISRNIISVNVGEKYAGVTPLGGDFMVPASVCQKSSLFICFHSTLFDFSIPKNFPNGGRCWKVKDARYCILGAPYTIKIMGKPIRVWTIKARVSGNKNIEIQYLYSMERGLVAYTELNKDGEVVQATQILLDKCGFAAHGCKLEKSQLSK